MLPINAGKTLQKGIDLQSSNGRALPIPNVLSTWRQDNLANGNRALLCGKEIGVDSRTLPWSSLIPVLPALQARESVGEAWSGTLRLNCSLLQITLSEGAGCLTMLCVKKNCPSIPQRGTNHPCNLGKNPRKASIRLISNSDKKWFVKMQPESVCLYEPFVTGNTG